MRPATARGPGARRLAGLLAPLLLSSCLSERLRETAETVLTLQSGTMSELREKRGQGPFLVYDLPPGELLDLVEQAARRARDAAGQPVRAIFRSDLRREVVAKERAPEDSHRTDYEPPFRTAMLAVVHPIRGSPRRSRLEIHAVCRGPFHAGVVQWERDLPRWMEEIRAQRRAGGAKTLEDAALGDGPRPEPKPPP